MRILLVLGSAAIGALAGSVALAHEGEDHDTPDLVSGELTVIQADDFANHRSEVFHFLEDKHTGKVFQLRFQEAPPGHLRSGMKVIVRGHASGSEIVVAAGGGGVQPVDTAAAAVGGEQKAVVLLINFMDAALECSQSFVTGLMFSNAQSVDGLYQETSYGNVWFTGNVFGPYTINYLSTGTCDYNGWASAVEAAAQAAGVNLSLYNRRVYVFPKSNPCGWAGLGTIGGNPSKSWIAYCDLPDVYAHEIGHNVTMHHSSTDTNNDGTLDCEYCDTSDFMGYGGVGYRQVNAPHKEQMGWLPASKITSVGSDATFNVAPLELAPSSTPYPQALKITRTGGGYDYISYRRRLGYDANLSTSYSDRANIHSYAGSGAVQTKFLAGLLDAQYFTDTASGATITQLGHNTDFVTVQVSFTCATATPTATMSPASRSAAPGATLTYSVSVTDNDTANCSPATFNLAPTAPSGWTVSVAPTSLNLSPGQTGTATLTVTSPTATPTGNYTVSVAVSDNFNVGHAATASATYTVDATAPTTPTNLRVTVKKRQNALLWNASTDNVGVTAYLIWRNGINIAQTTTTSYTDRSVTAGATYSYCVTARDAAGNESAASNTVTVKAR